jgi:cysteine synthase
VTVFASRKKKFPDFIFFFFFVCVTFFTMSGAVFGGKNLFGNILQTVGRTPVVRINRLAPANVNMFVKVESFNPMSSVKDRLAVAIVEDAERRGKLKPGDTIVEATSGNTGIALAMVSAAKGYNFVAVMADSFSVERRKLMKYLGAKVVLTPAAERGTGMVKKAKELAEERGWFLADQFANDANPEFHANTTGAEILSDFAGSRLDYFVNGWGTGGTISGAGRTLKAARPDLRIVIVEPEGAAQLLGKPWAPHMLQGMAPDLLPEVLDRDIYDDIVTVSNEEAIATSRNLAQKEGIFCGISSGATFAASLRVAESAPDGSTFLAVLPDTGERYLSTPLFEGISEASDQV